MMLPSRSTLISDEAVISSYIMPNGLIRKCSSLARHARRDVVEVQVGHAVEIDQPIAGGEVDARFPFGGVDVGRLRVGRVDLGDVFIAQSPKCQVGSNGHCGSIFASVMTLRQRATSVVVDLLHLLRRARARIDAELFEALAHSGLAIAVGDLLVEAQHDICAVSSPAPRCRSTTSTIVRNAAFATVGTCGRNDTRRSDDTATARSAPDCTCPMTPGKVSNAAWICRTAAPSRPRRSCGTARTVTFRAGHRDEHQAPRGSARLPTLMVPKLNFAGSALAAAMMSPTFLSGLSLATTMTKSNVADRARPA